MTEYVDAGHAVDWASLSGVARSAPPVTQNVDYERILRARSEPQNWLTYFGAYDGQRYSLLEQINTENVRRLTPAWVFQYGASGLQAGGSTYAWESAPVVVDGIMYVTAWDGWVFALDAQDGRELWRYHHATPFDTSLCCGNVNRGVAVAQGKVFVVSPNAHVLALDAETGQCVWDRTNGDVRSGESATAAPLIVKNLVIVGSAGGEFGVRGHLDAYDLETGDHVWRTYTVPKPGEPGSETWPAEGEAWARGGGNPWITPTYDPELNLLYTGTGNPAPDFDGEVRPGDNLYTDSCIAVNPDNGQLIWHYQQNPHDLWDYDSISENLLFDHDGRKLLAHFNKNGYAYVLDRTNGAVERVFPFVDRIDWGQVDAKGRITVSKYPDKEGEPVHFYPGPGGGKEWTHNAYSPKTGLIYVPVQDVGATATRRRREFKEGIPYWGAGVQVDATGMAGSVSAFDPIAGREVWRYRTEMPMCASVLATAGDLVFAGEPRGDFNALNARTGELLWRFQCGSGHHSSPTTYSAGGRQYIAVPSGWGGWIEGFAPGMLAGTHGAALFAFALPD